MAEVTLTIGARQYPLHCKDGEEAHLSRLAEIVEGKVAIMSGVTEVRALLFAALFLADDLIELKAQIAGQQTTLPLPTDDGPALAALESLAGRIEALAERLAPAHAAP